MSLEQRMGMEQDLQLSLQQDLIYGIELIRDITIEYIKKPVRLNREISQLIINANNNLNYGLLEKAIGLDIRFHNGQHREKQDDPEIVHHFQAGYAVALTNGSIDSVIGAIHHDTLEQNWNKHNSLAQNRNKRNEILNVLYSALGPKHGPRIIYLMLNHTNDSTIEDSNLKKALLAEQIRNASEKDPLKRLYHIRVCERISNLLNLDGIGTKEGRTSEERKLGVINDTIKETLGMAYSLDKLYASRKPLKFYPLLTEIISTQIQNIFSLEKPEDYSKTLNAKRLFLIEKVVKETLPLSNNADIKYQSALSSSIMHVMDYAVQKYDLLNTLSK